MGPGYDEMDPVEMWRNGQQYLSEMSEANFLSKVVIKLYGRPWLDPTNPHRYFVAVFVGSGQKVPEHPDDNSGQVQPLVLLHVGVSLEDMQDFLRKIDAPANKQ